ncbi:hypothetical protein GCM10010193_34310 [Kitasatospora atroaurantiaca]
MPEDPEVPGSYGDALFEPDEPGEAARIDLGAVTLGPAGLSPGARAHRSSRGHPQGRGELRDQGTTSVHGCART